MLKTTNLIIAERLKHTNTAPGSQSSVGIHAAVPIGRWNCGATGRKEGVHRILHNPVMTLRKPSGDVLLAMQIYTSPSGMTSPSMGPRP